MDIGSYHVDLNVVAAALLVVGSVIGLRLLKRDERKNHESPVARAVRLTRETGLQPERTYYVPDGATEALIASRVNFSDRRSPRPGLLVRMKDGKLYTATVQANTPLSDQQPRWSLVEE